MRLLTYTFSEIKVYFSSRGFLDIEKSVLLELKGVKVIRSYRDFFQLIRDFLRINDTFRLFYMILLIFVRVINLIAWSKTSLNSLGSLARGSEVDFVN